MKTTTTLLSLLLLSLLLAAAARPEIRHPDDPLARHSSRWK
jgi:hypothetical protein